MFKLLTLSLGLFFLWNASGVAQNSSCGEGYVYTLTVLGWECMQACQSDSDCAKSPINAVMVCVAGACHYHECQESSDCFSDQVCKTLKGLNGQANVCFYK